MATTGRGLAPQTGLRPTVAATINATTIPVAVVAMTVLRRDICPLSPTVHSVSRICARVEEGLASWPGGAEERCDGVVVVAEVGPREPHDKVLGPGPTVLGEPGGGRLQRSRMTGLSLGHDLGGNAGVGTHVGVQLAFGLARAVGDGDRRISAGGDAIRVAACAPGRLAER